jgi:hypothetical protein
MNPRCPWGARGRIHARLRRYYSTCLILARHRRDAPASRAARRRYARQRRPGRDAPRMGRRLRRVRVGGLAGRAGAPRDASGPESTRRAAPLIYRRIRVRGWEPKQACEPNLNCSTHANSSRRSCATAVYLSRGAATRRPGPGAARLAFGGDAGIESRCRSLRRATAGAHLDAALHRCSSVSCDNSAIKEAAGAGKLCWY